MPQGMAPTQQELADMIAAVDTGNTGDVSFREFLNLMEDGDKLLPDESEDMAYTSAAGGIPG